LETIVVPSTDTEPALQRTRPAIRAHQYNAFKRRIDKLLASEFLTDEDRRDLARYLAGAA
jgi:hypothetical protein